MKCQEVAPEIEIYAIGALAEEEMSAVENHLKTCSGCRALLERYEATLESLALEASATGSLFEPPPGHKERFLNKLSQRPQLRPGSKSAEELAEEARTRPAPAPVRPTKSRRGNRWGGLGRLAPAAFGVVVALVLALGLWTLNLQMQLDQQQVQNRTLVAQLDQQRLDVNGLKQLNEQLSTQKNELVTQVSAISGERETLKQQVSQLNDVSEQARVSQNVSLLLTKPGATTRTATTSTAGVTVLMAPDEKNVALFAHSWPSLKEGQEYHVWLYHTTGTLVSGGTLKLLPLPSPNISEGFISVPEPMTNYTTLFITIERPGVQTPSGPELIRDALA